MVVNDELPSLLAALYAAPLEAHNWQIFFDNVCALTHTASGYLISSDRERGNMVIAGGGKSYDPEVFTLYNEHYGENDPFQAPFEANPRTGVIDGEELVPHAELVRTELWNDLLRARHLEYVTMVCTHCSEGTIDVLSLWRGPGYEALDRSSIHLLLSLVPHVRMAIELRKKIETTSASSLLSETALDAMGTCAFLVDSRGRIQHRNRLASQYLLGADSLQVYEGRLVIADSSQDAHLQALIKRACTGRHTRGGSAAPCGGAMSISRLCAPSSFQLAVVPVPDQCSGTRGGLPVRGAAALIFVIDAAAKPRGRAGLMRQLFHLTPTEARMADLLLQGLEMREAAERLCITLATARFHLKRVFVKTRTHRQTELMRLMLALPAQPEQNQFLHR